MVLTPISWTDNCGFDWLPFIQIGRQVPVRIYIFSLSNQVLVALAEISRLPTAVILGNPDVRLNLVRFQVMNPRIECQQVGLWDDDIMLILLVESVEDKYPKIRRGFLHLLGVQAPPTARSQHLLILRPPMCYQEVFREFHLYRSCLFVGFVR